MGPLLPSEGSLNLSDVIQVFHIRREAWAIGRRMPLLLVGEGDLADGTLAQRATSEVFAPSMARLEASKADPLKIYDAHLLQPGIEHSFYVNILVPRQYRSHGHHGSVIAGLV